MDTIKKNTLVSIPLTLEDEKGNLIDESDKGKLELEQLSDEGVQEILNMEHHH